MQSSRYLTVSPSRVVVLILLLSMLAASLGVAQAQAAPPPAPIAQQQALSKIEPELLQSLGETSKADFFIWMTEQADLSPAAGLTTKVEKGQFVYNALRATAERSQAGIRAQLDALGVRYRPFYIANKIMVFGGTRATALNIAARPDVARLTPNRQYQLPRPIINPKATTHITAIEPNITFIRADQVWNLGVNGAGTVLAGNDTGLQWDHPAIKNHYRGWNGVTADHNYNWWDATGTYPNAPADGGAHGTHTTGTMVGDDGGANKIGVAPGAQTIHCKNMTDGGSGSDYTFSVCFEWDLAPWDLSGANPRPDLAPHAINNSWGYWGGNYPAFEDEIDALQAAGIVVEVSAGNEGPNCTTLRSPGDHDQVLTTGSVNHASGVLPGTLTGFSSRGPSLLDPGAFVPDVMAPGENIRSSVPGSGYQGGWSGTSMAGPHVTALVGLMWSANPAMMGMVEQTYDLIRQTAVPLTSQMGSQCGGDYNVGPNNDWGYGAIDALAAVNAAIAFGNVGTLQGTVTSAADSSPIANALVKIIGGGWTFTVYTDGAGFYTRQVPAGLYDVTASKYGFYSATATGVEVFEDATTVQDFALEVAPMYTVSGRVTDSQTGWPLFARIAIDGYPGGPIWTDPQTGNYSIDLVADGNYTFDVTAWVDGYLPQQRGIGVLQGPQTEDFFLDADPMTCMAPGYVQSVANIDEQDFEANNGGYTRSGSTSWQHGVPTSGPGAAHSGDKVWATNLSGNYNDNEDGAITSPAFDLSAYVGQNLHVRWWEWLNSEQGWDYAYVEASNDGGASWNGLYIATGNASPVWTERTSFLGDDYAVSNFRLRFRFYSDFVITAPGWYIDDVALQTTDCTPPASGGLVVGNVYDGNTMAGVDGALVENEDGFSTTTATAPDPAGRGFYTLFSPAGSKLFTASRQLYSPDTATVNVPIGDAVRQDFVLKTGFPVVSPESLSAITPMGQISMAQLDLQNQGEGSFNFEVVESSARFTPVGDPLGQRRNDAPAYTTPAEKSSQATSEGLALPPVLTLQTLNAGDVIQTWLPTANPNPWGIAYLANDTVWVGEGWGDGHADEYLPDGSVAGLSHPYAWNPSYGPADFTFNINTEMIWIMDVGTTNCIYEFDPGAGATGQTICPPWGTSQRGLAYDPWTDTYFGGGWNEGMIYRFAPDGSIIDAANVGLPIAGLAFNPDTQHLFVMVNSDPNPVVVIDVAAGYTPIGQFSIPGFPAYGGAGLELDCEGNLWAVEQDSNAVYEVESGEATSWCGQDIPWLDADPDFGALDPGGNQTIDVTFDASVPMVNQPGHYTARLNIKTDTPYGQLRVPVTMTVTPPPTWGKLMGVVSTPGYCAENPALLEKAQVEIEGSQGFAHTLQTSADGAFSYWLDESESPLTLTVSKDGYEQQQVFGVMITGQTTTTQDVALRILLPCVSVTPPSIDAVVELEQTTAQQAVMENSGASAADFSFSEVDGGFDPLSLPTVQLPAFTPTAAGGATYFGDHSQAQPARTFTPPANAYYSAVSVNVLLLAAADINSIRMILDSFPDIGQVDHYDARVSTPSLADLLAYDAVVVISNNPFANATAVGDVLADYVDAGGKVVQTVATFYDPWGSGWGLRGRFVTDGYSPFIGVGDWFSWGQLGAFDASHPIMQGVMDAGDFYRQVMELAPGAEWVASWNDDEFVATKGSVVALNTFLADGYAWYGDIPLIVHNSIIWLQGDADVPWLSQEPASGVVGPDSQLPVDVIFDARSPTITQPGTYYATLKVHSSDPGHNHFDIPVSMTVTPPPTWGKLTGTVYSHGYCDAAPHPLADATVTIQGSQGGLWTVTTDANGVFGWWLDSAESPLTVTASAADHEAQQVEGVMVVGQETTTQDFSLMWLYPCISMDPLSFEETLRAGDVIVRTLTLYNGGAGMGIFEIDELHHGSSPLALHALSHTAGQLYVMNEDKNAHSEGTSGGGQPGPSAAGGPDAFGYIYRDSFEPDGPPYRWVEIAPPAGGDGIELAPLTGVDDGYLYPLELPFPFSFYGVEYDQLAVASNGTFYFDNAYLGFGNTPIPSLTFYNVQRFIAPLWDDLVIAPGAIYYQDLGAMFIIEFYQVGGYGSPEPVTWQAVFFPNGSILFQYQDVVFGDYRDFGGSATVGIQGDTSKGLEYSFDAPWLSNQLAICFAPPGVAPDCSTDVPWLDEVPPTGFVPPYSSTTVEVIFDATAPEMQDPATHYATLSVRTNDVFASPLRAPATLIVEPTDGPMLSVEPSVGVVHQPRPVDVNFTGAQFEIAATTFSLDFDQDCLAFDPSDDDLDGIPDAVQLHTPPAFAVSVTYNGGDLDGEIDFAISDNLPPLSSLGDGALATVTFTPICEPPHGEMLTAPVRFSNEPRASFGNTSGQSVPGTVEDGWVDILSGIRGDCNNDGVVDAADIVACVLEIFDGDGSFWLDTPNGDFPGNPVGCDSNADRKVDAGDIACTVLTIFEGQGACEVGVTAAADAAPAKLILSDVTPAPPGSTVQATLSLSSGGRGVAAAVLALDVDRAWLRVNPSDADEDGVIDAVKLNAPAGMAAAAQVNAKTGALEIYMADLSAPLTTISDGVIATITLEVVGAPEQASQPGVFFARSIEPSLGDVNGQSAPVETISGAPEINSEPGAVDQPIKTYLPTVQK